MKVKQLREKLARMPGNAEVLIADEAGYDRRLIDISKGKTWGSVKVNRLQKYQPLSSMTSYL